MLITGDFDTWALLASPSPSSSCYVVGLVFFFPFLRCTTQFLLFFFSDIGANFHHVLYVLNPHFFLACPITGMEPRFSLCQSSVWQEEQSHSLLLFYLSCVYRCLGILMQKRMKIHVSSVLTPCSVRGVYVCACAWVCVCVCDEGCAALVKTLSRPSLPESVKKAVCYIHTHI